MKKITAIVLSTIMVLSALSLASCGGGGSDADLSDSRYVGTWTTKGIEIGEDSEELEGEWLLVLNEDGTGTLSGSLEGEEEDPSEFTWKLVDGGFKCSGDVKATFKDVGDNIKTKIIGVELVFEKQQ